MVSELLNNKEYMVLQNDFDIKYMFGKNKIFNVLLEEIVEGYPEEHVKQKHQDLFAELTIFLKNRKLSIDEAAAIYLYTADYYFFATDITNPESALFEFKQDLYIDLMKDVPREAANEIIDRVVEIANRSEPIYQKYEITKNELIVPLGMNSKRATINAFIRKISLLHKMQEIQDNLRRALNKSTVGIDIKLFRASNLKNDLNIDEFLNREIELSQIVSVSATKEHSFAKYVHFNAIIEFFVDQNTHGMYIANMSCYDTEEQEVILMPKTIKIIDIQKQEKKTIIKCLVF